MKDISIKDFQIGNDQDFTLMGGMNVLESEDTALLVAEKFKEVTDKLKINWIFKASFDKANRSSIESILEGVEIKENSRLISGNPLTGLKVEKDNFLGFYHHQLTVLPEGNEYKFFLQHSD